jgi:Uma2 family endonuclease
MEVTMAELAQVESLYQIIEKLPPNYVGEIVDGVLQAHPRPSARHGIVATRLAAAINSTYDVAKPGGWWVIAEPEVHFARDQEVLVPDIAAWKRERLLDLPQNQRFEVVPDWVCEVLSPSKVDTDRKTKMRVYAAYGVDHVWLADPMQRVVEAFRLHNSEWARIGKFASVEPIRADPFAAITIAPPWA